MSFHMMMRKRERVMVSSSFHVLSRTLSFFRHMSLRQRFPTVLYASQSHNLMSRIVMTRHQASPMASQPPTNDQQSTTNSTNSTPVKPKTETIIEQAIREAKGNQPEDPINIYSVPALKIESVTPQAPVVKKSLWTRVKEEASHYWHGSKLLGKEVSISSRLLVKLLQGSDLSRREQRQLKRTTGDLLRLVPFVIIVLIPFLEFALPILLRLFPNMLPSTFESKSQEEAKKKQLLKVRLEMAKFLQETVAEVSLSGTSKADAAREFSDFFHKCRMDGSVAPTEEVLRVARKFQDELTLTNLSRPQLVSMAKYMNLTPFGTDAFLRLQIERKLEELHRDDQMIADEGVANLTLPELQQVCLARGIRTTTVGVSPAQLREEVQQWLDLHLVHNIPSSLLVLSHAFQTTDRPVSPGKNPLEDRAQAIQATLSSLPHQVVNEAQLQVSEAEGVATYKQKLDVLKEQEEMIEDELEQEATQAAAKKAKEEEEASLKKAQEDLSVAKNTNTLEQAPIHEEIASATPPVEQQQIVDASTPASSSLDTSVTMTTQVSGDSIVSQGADEDDRLSEEELKKLGDALKTRAKEGQLSDVKAQLEGLKEERKEFKEDIEELKQVTKKEPVKVSDQLGSRLDKMLAKIEAELSKYDSELEPKLDSLTEPTEASQVSISELEEILKVIQDHPKDDRIKKIVKKLDADGDGLVAMQEILALVDGQTETTPAPSEAKPEPSAEPKEGPKPSS